MILEETLAMFKPPLLQVTVSLLLSFFFLGCSWFNALEGETQRTILNVRHKSGTDNIPALCALVLWDDRGEDDTSRQLQACSTGLWLLHDSIKYISTRSIFSPPLFKVQESSRKKNESTRDVRLYGEFTCKDESHFWDESAVIYGCLKIWPFTGRGAISGHFPRHVYTVI